MEYNYEYSGNVSPEVGAGIFAGAMLVNLIIVLIVYVYFAFCIYKIAQKTNTPNAWLAWIPIIQAIPLIQAGKKPVWWIILMLIPIVNIIVSIIVWMAVAEALGKPSWLGVLIIVPVANLILPAYLAFSGSSSPAAPTATPPTSPA